MAVCCGSHTTTHDLLFGAREKSTGVRRVTLNAVGTLR